VSTANTGLDANPVDVLVSVSSVQPIDTFEKPIEQARVLWQRTPSCSRNGVSDEHPGQRHSRLHVGRPELSRMVPLPFPNDLRGAVSERRQTLIGAQHRQVILNGSSPFAGMRQLG
jgi:hypothetical protein